MKILLIRPNSRIQAAPPPMGSLYLAGYLRKVRSGKDEVLIHDARAEFSSVEEVGDVMHKFQPDIVGITALTMEADTAHSYTEQAKLHVPGCTTIIGGPYGSSNNDEALKDKNLDFTAKSEGELTLVKVLEALESGGEIAGIKGIGYRNNGEAVAATFPDLIQNLDELPYPAWDALDIEKYFKFGRVRGQAGPIQTRPRGMSIISTRGCPYQCTYCHNLFGKKFRKRSAEHVLGEIRHLVEDYQVGEIEFLDDVFNLDRARAEAICDGIIEAGWDLRIAFPNGLRADQMDEALVDKMRAAGTWRICYAVESGTPRIQKMIKKKLNLEKTKHIIDYTADQGILTGGFYLFGFRDETEEEVWNTINFAVSTKMHTANFFHLTPYPDTPMYDEALALGYDMKADYSDYYELSANMSKISNERITELRRIAFRRFYFSPKRLWSIFKAVPNKWFLFKNILMWIRVALTGKELKSKH